MRPGLIIAATVLATVASIIPARAETRVGPLSVAEEHALKPKDTFRECDNCPEMIAVPTGSFTMGSSPATEIRYSFEGPQHRVTIARPFAVGKFALTFEEWDACVNAAGEL